MIILKLRLAFIEAIFLTLLCSMILHSQTIYSTTAGGPWHIDTTWVGGVLPSDGDNVVINGPVKLYNLPSNKCKNLTINADKKLYSASAHHGELRVSGNVINNGTVCRCLRGISMYAAGNVTNNGSWGGSDCKLTLTGGDQTISQAPGCGFEAIFNISDSSTNVYLGSNVHFTFESGWNCNHHYAELYTSGYTFKLDGGSLKKGRIISNDTLDLTTHFSDMAISGNFFLKGTLKAYNTNILQGTVTNFGTLQSASTAYHHFIIDGNINNYGTVTARVYINGNIDNHGTWISVDTRFTGSSEKQISQSPGTAFEGKFLVNDTSAVITLASDVTLNLTPSFNLGNATLNCGTYNVTANTDFLEGTIISNGEINQHGKFANITFEGNVTLRGSNKMQQCIINDTVVNLDTIYYTNANYFLTVNGFLKNYGTIEGIRIDLYGDLTNHGDMSDYSTRVEVKGDVAQTINLSQPINRTYFHAMIQGNSYQWMKDGTDIQGANQSYLLFNPLQLTDDGVYKCRIDTGGTSPVYSREITVNQTIGVNKKFSEIPGSFILYQNYPNPFNPSTNIKFDIPKSSHTKLIVYDILGKEVATLVNEKLSVGSYEVDWNASGYTSGVYFYKLIADDYVNVKKMLLVK